MLVSQMREEEKLILQAAERRGIETTVLFDRQLVLNLTAPNPPAVDIVLDRCMAHVRGGVVLRVLNRWGIPTINSAETVTICDDKAEMSALFGREGIPSPRTALAFSVESALAIAETFGYPVVLKPTTGSWGRLLARANTPSALKTILAQKQQHGSPQHGVFYIQEFVEKPGRDIRVFVVGHEVIAASYRNSEHWITNVARGAVSTAAPVTGEIRELALRTAASVGAELAGIDLVETGEGLSVIEINSGAEFKGLRGTTSLSIPDVILDYALEKVTKTRREAVQCHG
jgi:[lysine-biosynthesis-protein LysW]--L-2-aminoadipate ligase